MILAPPLSIEPLDNAVQDQANPRIHQQTNVDPKGLMPACRGEVLHQDEKVKHAACNHGNELLEKSSKHALVGHSKWHIRCQEKQLFAFALRYSPFASAPIKLSP